MLFVVENRKLKGKQYVTIVLSNYNSGNNKRSKSTYILLVAMSNVQSRLNVKCDSFHCLRLETRVFKLS